VVVINTLVLVGISRPAFIVTVASDNRSTHAGQNAARSRGQLDGGLGVSRVQT
jgi:hypothetical protein